ncbi:recombinase family protein [Paenibacillus sp. GYB004]|uniref:recombinase family protein n=1 Tax=Paenibacillus sp. GYB004 TaxID=2994393 RepID=UPI002F96E4C7
MIPISNKRAALYIRVSLEEQTRHGFSVEGQLVELRQYCKANNLDIHDVYIDGGASGSKTAGRPELGRILTDADQGKFDLVLIWRVSRLSRNFTDLLNIVEHLNRSKVKLCSLNEHFDTGTALGQFILQMIGAAAELERVNITDNLRIAMNQRSKLGIWNAGNNVLGYRWTRDPNTNNGQVEVVPEEANLVNHIFEWYASGDLGFKAISNRLNRAGHRTKLGNPFSIHAVRNILNNCNYIGMVRFCRSENIRTKGAVQVGWAKGDHAAIVDLELWNFVQNLLSERFAPPLRKIDRAFPLAGLLKCPRCGKSMVPWHTDRKRKDGTSHTNYYYLCSTYNSKGTAGCRPNVVRADKAEQWFFEQIRILLSAPETFEKIVAATNAKQQSDTTPSLEEVRQVEKLLKELAQQKEELFRSFESGRISKEEFTSAIIHTKQQLMETQAAKERMDDALAASERAVVNPDHVRAALSRLRQVFDSSSEKQQNRLLRLLVDKITMPVDRDIQRATIHSTNALLNLQIPTLTEVN